MLAYKSGKLFSINPEEYKEDFKSSRKKLNAMFKAVQSAEKKEINQSEDNTKKRSNK